MVTYLGISYDDIINLFECIIFCMYTERFFARLSKSYFVMSKKFHLAIVEDVAMLACLIAKSLQG